MYRGTLKEIKAKLRKHLKVLEEEYIVSKDDGYQGIITSVAKDICNRNKYRQIQIKVCTKEMNISYQILVSINKFAYLL